MKKMSTLIAMFLALTIALAPVRSEAAIGLGLGASGAGSPAAVPTMVVGGVLMAVGAGTVIGGIAYAVHSANDGVVDDPFECCAAAGNFLNGMGVALIGAGVVLSGLIVLDDQGTPVIAFTSLTPEQAAQLQLTDAEFKVYSDNVEQVEAIRQSIVQEMLVTENASVQLAASQWQTALTELFGAGTDDYNNAGSAIVKILSQQSR